MRKSYTQFSPKKSKIYVMGAVDEMAQEKNNFCFCTFTSGQVYRNLTKLLANDIEKYAHGIPFIILTDKPSDFSEFSEFILGFKHRRKGVYYHHERRFAINKALSMFDSCMYLDADTRICAPVSFNRQWLPGITARSCTNMNKHFRERLERNNSPSSKAVKQFNFWQKVGHKIGVNIEDDKVKWINEFLFVVTKDSGKEVKFLELWGKLALYGELNGYLDDPAQPIGLAAAKVGLPIRHDVMEGLDFFDDRIEKIRISKGESDPNAKRKYFEAQYEIENRNRTIAQKIFSKISKFLDRFYQLNRVRIVTLLNDFDFYYR